MPIKRRTPKHRRFAPSEAAIARWKAIGPAAITAPCIIDERLADLLGLLPFIAMPASDLNELRAALDEGVRYAG